MSKLVWEPATLLNPLPVVMVTCSDSAGKPNIITLAWTGTINSIPPMVSISVRKERYSHQLISDKKQFAINLVTKDLVYAADYCGVKSGRDIDKFKETKLNTEKASRIDVPIIVESPVNIECLVRDVLELGSHDMFIADVLAVNVDEKFIDNKGKFEIEKTGLVCYSHGKYYEVNNKSLGFYGFSVAKRKTKKPSKRKNNKTK